MLDPELKIKIITLILNQYFIWKLKILCIILFLCIYCIWCVNSIVRGL